jgi:hypothetical protein
VIRALAAAVCLALLAPLAEAQEGTPLVRLRVGSSDVVQGYLRGNSPDELVVFTSDRQYRHVPRAGISSIEVRERLGSHWKRGALMGVFLWASLMFAASIDELEDAGTVSWESAAVLAGSMGLGAAIGKAVPRHGWRETSLDRLPRPLARVTFRF